MQESIRILHIDTEPVWKGGQQQAIYLYEYLLANGYVTTFVCRPDSELARYCDRHGLPYQTTGLWNELDLYSAKHIARFARAHGYNILHLHSGHALSIGLLTKLFYRKLVLVGVRRVDFSVDKHFLSRWKYSNRYLDAIVCVSAAIRDVLLRDGIPPEKIEVIHSGVDTEKFRAAIPPESYRSRLGIPEKAILVGTVASLVDHKDYPTLLKAARIVTQQHDNIYFCAAGDGEMEKDLKAMYDGLGLGDRFRFLGFRQDIGELLNTLDIFVLASKMEGLGTSVLDAMAVELPVIGTRAGGIPEMVDDGETGYLVPPQKPEALANRIIDLAENPQLQERFGQAGRQKVRQFSMEKTASRNIELYRRLVSTREPAHSSGHREETAPF